MERPLTLKPLSIQDENSAIHRKKATAASKIPRQVAKKSRKALNDITNKSDGYLHRTGAVSKKRSSPNQKQNIAEEGFLHDHSKCIAAQKSSLQLNFWDTVLPGHDSSALKVEEVKVDDADIHLELEEILISDSFKSCWKSHPSSPLHRDSPPFAWELDPPELMLRPDESSDV